ncbi:MAG: hypothetical protein V7750_12520 [Sneathiella sp.]
MRPKILQLSGTTRRDRNQVIAEINAAISSAGGWIIDHTLFSNIAITLQFELPGEGIGDFKESLTLSKVALQEDSKAELDQAITTYAQDSVDLKTTLNVTFIHDEPDLRRDIAAVPG